MSTLNGNRIEERKRAKWKSIIVITIIEILVAIWASDVIVQMLEILFNGNISHGLSLELSYIGAVSNFIHNNINKYIFVFCEVGYALFLIMIQNPYEEKIDHVDTFMVTPSIEKPVPAGNGQ